MSKAGLFSGEVVENAPANGAATTKQNGHQWMSWGTATPPPTKTANELIKEAGPHAMYTFQDASFATTLIDEMGTYPLTTNIQPAGSAPVVVANPWRSTNAQYCQMVTAQDSTFDDAHPWEAGNLMFDVASGLATDFTMIWGFRITDADYSEFKGMLDARSDIDDQKFSIYRPDGGTQLVCDMLDSGDQNNYGAFYGASDDLSDGLPHIISWRKTGTLLEYKADNRNWTTATASTPYFSSDNQLPFKIGSAALGFTTLSADHDVGAIYGKTLTREQIDLIHSTYRNEII